MSIFCFLDEKYLLVIFYLYTVHWNVKGYFGNSHKNHQKHVFLNKISQFVSHENWRQQGGKWYFSSNIKNIVIAIELLTLIQRSLKDIVLLNLQFFLHSGGPITNPRRLTSFFGVDYIPLIHQDFYGTNNWRGSNSVHRYSTHPVTRLHQTPAFKRLCTCLIFNVLHLKNCSMSSNRICSGCSKCLLEDSMFVSPGTGVGCHHGTQWHCQCCKLGSLSLRRRRSPFVTTRQPASIMISNVLYTAI